MALAPFQRVHTNSQLVPHSSQPPTRAAQHTAHTQHNSVFGAPAAAQPSFSSWIMGDPFRQRDHNPFAESTLYELNTTYVPPDLNDTVVDAVVPAIGGAPVAAAGAAAAAPHAAAVSAGPGAPAAAGTVPALPFTESNLSSTHVAGNIGRPGTAGLPTSSAPAAAAAAAGGFGGRPGSAPPGPHTSSTAATSLPGDADDPSQYPFYNVRRYRPYFDVDTNDVVWRVGSSFLGPFRPDFMAVTLSSPDLYGPFWVATTLIFVTAVAGNYADFVAFRSGQKHAAAAAGGGNSTTPGGSGSVIEHQWYTNYAKMSYSALLFYGYVFVLGLALFFALRWFRSEIKLANVWCIYGYSLTIFIPSAFVCIAPLSWLRWLAVGLATGLSGLFIVANLKTSIYEAAPARAALLLAIIGSLHAGVGLALRLYFFRFPGVPEVVTG